MPVMKMAWEPGNVSPQATGPKAVIWRIIGTNGTVSRRRNLARLSSLLLYLI
jgi:hypothetical protein